MGADYRLIRLSRKTNNKIIGESNGVQQYLSTDYFDVLHCVNKKTDDNFCSIMGIGEGGQQTADEIAIQSYALYCSEDTLSRYEGRKGYRDPFEDPDKNKHFLSLIQVYITPEITARTHVGEDFSAHTFLLEIEADIHAILDEFIVKNEKDISYRIYNLLSTGDFAVVIRSMRSETSFEISTALRRRYASIQDGTGTKKLVLYKTYTLLTMAEGVINAEVPEPFDQTATENQFVIRCCYSNKYWSEKNQIDIFWRDINKRNIRIYSLNGRYDFTVYLTEQEFKEVFPYIVQYKHIGTDTNVFNRFDECSIKEYNGVNYLVYLMKNDYVSYVNERYLLKTVSEQGTMTDKSLLAGVRKREFVSLANDNKYNEVLKLHIKVTNKLRDMYTNRRELFHYMELLGKLLDLCQTINSLSDTRIYASVLLDQISVLLVSINSYIDCIDDYNAGSVLTLIGEYLKESVGALDKYSQYIRNNNLQSLQTPNYNIESNTSMEKLLIAYGEFVYSVIEGYMGSKVAYQAGEKTGAKRYLPIVVPDLKKDTISVEVMFPEWNIYGKGLSEEIGCNQNYLMVITCPTLMELGDVPSVIASLFHEIAHQFRYEERMVRNHTILEYTLRHFFEVIAVGIIKEFELDKSAVDIQKDLSVIVRDSMLKAFKEIWCNSDVSFMFQNQEAPLAYFEECIVEDVENFLKSWNRAEDILTYIRAFVGWMLPYMPVGNAAVDKSLKALDMLAGRILESKEHDIWEKNIIRLQRRAFFLYAICGKEILKNQKEDLKRWNRHWADVFQTGRSRTMVIPWDAVAAPEDDYYFDGFHAECQAKLAGIRAIVLEFCMWLEDLRSDSEQYRYAAIQKMNKMFGERVYEYVCDAWAFNSQDYLNRGEEALYLIQSLDEVGRYYGIDYKSLVNRKNFLQLLGRNITRLGKEATEKIQEDIAAYREETSDLFMCSSISFSLTGYVNLMAQKLHIDDTVLDMDLQRIIRVAAVQWCDLNAKDFKDFYKSYQNQCVILMKETVSYVNEIFAYYNVDAEWSVPVIQWGNDFSDDLASQFAEQIIDMINFVRSQKVEDLACIDDLLHAESMLKIIYSMVQVSFLPLYKFYEDAVLKADYLNGVRTLRSLRSNDVSEYNDVVKALCKEIKDVMNQPYKKYQDAKKNLNRSIIEFLLVMHYENKRRYARKTEEATNGS